MSQMDMLYDFQVADIKADHIEKDFRNSELRKKLETARTGFQDRQKQHKAIQDKLAMLADRKDAIIDALNRSKAHLENLMARKDSVGDSFEAVHALRLDVDHCLETIKEYEAELNQLCKTVRESSQRAVKLREDGLRFRKEFEELKPRWDAESDKWKADYRTQRALAEQKKEGIEESLLTKYSEIKMRVSPPIARIVNDQCSGCHTRLNNAMKQRVRNTNEIVECQTCGRMLYAANA